MWHSALGREPSSPRTPLGRSPVTPQCSFGVMQARSARLRKRHCTYTLQEGPVLAGPDFGRSPHRYELVHVSALAQLTSPRLGDAPRSRCGKGRACPGLPRVWSASTAALPCRCTDSMMSSVPGPSHHGSLGVTLAVMHHGSTPFVRRSFAHQPT